MTDTNKPVTRRTLQPHARHGRRILVTIGEGDVVGFRLERAKAGTTCFIPITTLYDIAERRRAEALSSFSAAPCVNPKGPRKL